MVKYTQTLSETSL